MRQGNYEQYNNHRRSVYSHRINDNDSRLIQLYGPNYEIEQDASTYNIAMTPAPVHRNSTYHHHHHRQPNEFNDNYIQNYNNAMIRCECCGGYHNQYDQNFSNASTESSYCTCACSCEVRCSVCGNMKAIIEDDDDMSMISTSDKSKQTECIELPYQNTDAYQKLLKELNFTIKRRNEAKLLREREHERCAYNNYWKYKRNY